MRTSVQTLAGIFVDMHASYIRQKETTKMTARRRPLSGLGDGLHVLMSLLISRVLFQRQQLFPGHTFPLNLH